MRTETGRPRWLMLFAGIAISTVVALGTVTVLGAAHASAQDNPSPDNSQVQVDLNAARATWAVAGPDSYEMTYYISCFCLEPLPRITVEVDHGVVVSATSSEGGVVRSPRTVISMFDEIQSEIDRPAAVIAATFDTETGRPELYGFDIDLMIADEEYSVVVENFVADPGPDYTELQEQLDLARLRWNGLGAATENYTMTYSINCFCPQRTVTAKVVGGILVGELDALTVDALFDLIQSEIDRPIDAMSATFNVDFGYPESASFDPILLAADDEFGYTITNFAFDQVCCDPIPTLNLATSCVSGNGRLDISFVSTAIADGPIEHELRIGRLAPRFHTVLSGETVTEVTTGRPDGQITVGLFVDGIFVTQATAAVDCDPPRPEVEVEVSCLAGNGRFDVYLTEPGGAALGVSLASVQRQQPLPPPFAQYVVYLEAANHPPLSPRQLNLSEGGEGRVVMTGRPDDLFTVRVQKNGNDVFSDEFTVDCDVNDEPVVLTSSCLAGNGRLDVEMFNPGALAANHVISVSGLADRSVLVGASESRRMSYTGRPDGPITVTVRRDGAQIFDRTVAIACDPRCAAGYTANGAECVTPHGCLAPQIELESVGGVPFVDPVTGEVTAIITHSCVASCDPPGEVVNAGLCRVFLP